MTFVFGHTHKPFQEDMNQGVPRVGERHNTGGWVVETDPQPLRRAVLVDEDPNAVSIRLANEVCDAKDYTVRVEEAAHGTEEHNPFLRG
jgi:hypothetical protein